METLTFLMTASFYPPYHLGGDANHVRYLAEALAARGHEVHVEYSPAALRLKRARPVADGMDDGGVHRHPVPAPTGRWQPLTAWIVGAPPLVRRHHEYLVREVRPDVIHYHNLSLLGPELMTTPSRALKLYTAHDYWVRCPRNDLFKFNQRLCERPTCLTCLALSAKPPQFWRYRPGGMESFDSLDATIAPSAFLKGMIQPYLHCPVVHIPNFAPDPNPAGTVKNPGNAYLYVGRLEFYKGIPELAAAAIAYRGPNRFVVVGKGKQRRVLETAKQAGAPIDLHGWLPSDQRDATYAGARALLLPSIWYENAPLVAFEALAWGTPLLCSELGALPELLHDGACGRTIAPTAAGIIEGLDAFEREELPLKLRFAARTAYEANHTPARYLEGYLRLLEQTWGRRGIRRPEDSSPSRMLPVASPGVLRRAEEGSRADSHR